MKTRLALFAVFIASVALGSLSSSPSDSLQAVGWDIDPWSSKAIEAVVVVRAVEGAHRVLHVPLDVVSPDSIVTPYLAESADSKTPRLYDVRVAKTQATRSSALKKTVHITVEEGGNDFTEYEVKVRGTSSTLRIETITISRLS